MEAGRKKGVGALQSLSTKIKEKAALISKREKLRLMIHHLIIAVCLRKASAYLVPDEYYAIINEHSKFFNTFCVKKFFQFAAHVHIFRMHGAGFYF